MTNPRPALQVCLFLIVISLPFVANLPANVGPDPSAETRTLASFPVLD